MEYVLNYETKSVTSLSKFLKTIKHKIINCENLFTQKTNKAINTIHNSTKKVLGHTELYTSGYID